MSAPNRSWLDFDIHDLATMVGLGSLAGSAVSVVWSTVSVNTIPSHVVLVVAFIGFLSGRWLSQQTRK